MQTSKDSCTLPKASLPAFTLVECMVALLISGLLAFSALQIIEMAGHLYSDYEKRTETALQLTGFQSALQQDFASAGEVTAAPGTITCEYPGHTVTYHFDETRITRTSLSGDIHTNIIFPLKVRKTAIFLNGEKQTGGRIDQFVCHLNDPDAGSVFSLFKHYSAHEYMMNHAHTN